VEKPKRPARHRRVREAAAARYTVEASPAELTGVLLDSDVVVEVLRGRKAVAAALSALEAGGVETFTCGVVAAEIFAGVRAGEEAATESFFHARGDVVIDGTTGRRAGSYLAKYARSHSVEIADALVAAAAATTGLRLWTLNRKHYPLRDVRFFDA
jgi:predicted nucleic acid-binding protein